MGRGNKTRDLPQPPPVRVWERLHAAPAWSRLHTDLGSQTPETGEIQPELGRLKPESTHVDGPTYYEARRHWKMALNGASLAIHTGQRIEDPHTIRLLLEHDAPIEARYD